MKKKLEKTVALVIILFAFTGNLFSKEVLLQAGTPLIFEFTESVNSSQISSGHMLNLRVKYDVKVGKITVIAAGTIMPVNVTKVAHAKIFGVPGKIELSATQVKSVDNQFVPISGNLNVGGYDRQPIAWGLVVFAAIPSLFIRGGEAEISAGTVLNATIAQSTVIETQENN